MTSTEAIRQEQRKARRFLRFSLRTWFIILTLICIGVFLGRRAWLRNELQTKIIRDGSIVYGEIEKHHQPSFFMDSSRGPVRGIPSPTVGMRDSIVPWISRWSEGSAAFCLYDSIEYHVGNVPMPIWVNDVLSTGELHRISLRASNPEIKLNLVTQNLGLVELSLMGQIHDPHTLRGIHRLEKLETLNIYGLDLSYEQVLPHGLPPNLVTVYMPSCNLKSSEIAIFKNCRKLESLTLRRGSFNLQELAKTGLPKTLSKADFYGSRVVKADLPLLATCPLLTELNLGHSEIDLRELDGMDLPVSIERLDLRGATLDDSTFRWLSRLPNLKSLELKGANFDDQDAKGIVLSPSLTEFISNDTNAGPYVAEMLEKTLRASQDRP